jgi:uncharacterized caspase-like protein
MRLLAALAGTMMLFVVGILPVRADKRVALVIGNDAYRNMPQLINAKNDAADVGTSLRILGFETIVATDLDRTGMNSALDRFSRTASGAHIALVYYSGHGMQFAGTNYLVPIDARLDSADDVSRFRLTPLDDVLEALKLARGAQVLVLDACRNNPVEREMKRRIAAESGANRDAMLTRGLKPAAAGNGLLIAYATQANDVANDGIGRNSPFTSAFLKHVGTPNIDIRQMLFRVQDDVDRITNHRQRPELAMSLVGEFYLNTTETDLEAWARLRDSNDPVQLNGFVKEYPTSILSTDALRRLAAIEREQAEREKAERDHLALERFEQERIAREQAERDRAERERLAAEQAQQAQIGIQSSASSQVAVLTPPAEDVPQATAKPTPLSGGALVREIKAGLSRVGCYAGPIDANWANGDTKAAVQKLVRYAKLSLNANEPSTELLEAIRGTSDRVCPVRCNAREVDKDGRCLAKTCGAGELLNRDGECRPRTEAKTRPSTGLSAIEPRSVPPSRPTDSASDPCANVFSKRRDCYFLLHHPQGGR